MVELTEGTRIQTRLIGAHERRETLLSIRLESVLISPEDNGAENIISAVVQEVVYLRDMIRVRALIADNTEISAKLSKGSRWANAAPWESIRFGWAVDDCYALDRAD